MPSFLPTSIRWDDPLSRGLIGVVVAGSNERVLELVSQQALDSTAFGSYMLHKGTKWGPGVLQQVSSNLSIAFKRTVPDSSPWSAMIAGRCFVGAAADRYSFYIYNKDQVSSAGMGQLNGPPRIRFINTAGSGANATVGGNAVYGEHFVITIHHDGTNPYFFYNGRRGSASARQRGLGGIAFSVTSSYAAEFYPAVIYAWAGKLPDTTHALFRADPTRLLRPRIWRGYNLSGPSAQTVSPGGIASGEAFGSATVQPGAVTVSPSSIASAEAFGSATVNATIQLSPSGITSGEAFGSATVTPGAATVSPSGIGSAEAFGSATVQATVSVSPTGIASGQTFGTAVVTPGAVTVTPTGISSGEAFGTATVSEANAPQTASPSSIASGEAFGSVTVQATVTVSPSSISSAETFGTATIQIGSSTVSPTGISTGEAFGTPVVQSGALTISPTGISSAESFGTPVTTSTVTLTPTGIGSSELFGTTTIQPGAVSLYPSSASTGETFGVPVAVLGQLYIPTFFIAKLGKDPKSLSVTFGEGRTAVNIETERTSCQIST